jgi:hypothetical protein
VNFWNLIILMAFLVSGGGGFLLLILMELGIVLPISLSYFTGIWNSESPW